MLRHKSLVSPAPLHHKKIAQTRTLSTNPGKISLRSRGLTLHAGVVSKRLQQALDREDIDAIETNACPASSTDARILRFSWKDLTNELASPRQRQKLLPSLMYFHTGNGHCRTAIDMSVEHLSIIHAINMTPGKITCHSAPLRSSR